MIFKDEDVKRVFLPPPAYQSYAPSSKTDSPVMNHKAFLADSRTYLDDPDKEHWQYEGLFQTYRCLKIHLKLYSSKQSFCGYIGIILSVQLSVYLSTYRTIAEPAVTVV